jgi:transcriptional regulator with XRE-family HTH domain
MAIKTGKDALKVRKDLGYSQEELAGKLGMVREGIARVEKQVELKAFQRFAYAAMKKFGLDWYKK